VTITLTKLPLCSDCKIAANSPGGEKLSLSLLWPPILPPDLGQSHSVCSDCMEIYPRQRPHHRSCPFRTAGLRLMSGGWATPFSEELRHDVRSSAPRFSGIMTNILGSLLRSTPDLPAIVTSIPMRSHPIGRDYFFDAISAAAGLHQVQVLKLVTRNKKQSTRKSVRQVRQSIAALEYMISPEFDHQVPGSNILLFDDNVTTGATMIGVANLLRAKGAQSVIPLSLDRTISPRLRQILLDQKPISCPHGGIHSDRR